MKRYAKAVLRPAWNALKWRMDGIAKAESGAALTAAMRRADDLENVLRETNERLGKALTRIDDAERQLARSSQIYSKVRTAFPDLFYSDQIERELTQYNDQIDVHELPSVFDYWSNKYILPLFHECGFSTVDEFYAKNLVQAAQRVGGTARFISIGAGNCDTEIRVVKLMLELGLKDFEFECLDLNPTMLDRGREAVDASGLGRIFRFVQGDFNAWIPSGEYAGVMANHSLHHVTNLEGLFDSIKASLNPRGYFVSSDMIGRNGHMRWPEALGHVERIWQELPAERRYNHQMRRAEPTFVNWDCSSEGFEGIRAQDILPLLVDRFDFPVFLAFGNVINPFVDRCFGPNFDADSADDRAFIDRIHAIDEAGFESGELTPTQMLAVMSPTAVDSHVYARGLSPQKAARSTN
ncbi:class I SAM-dependent methyltransferase [Variovorax sp. PAMC26660]|uniref:class I SAM-dependent methyltransferase n=1 Tax=Variovorax sp. PAMC26660 TaxID=2762322 RepID=UPI00164DB4C9|nr:class I SAM-dependent methyltransferase [Variovorax sp. PAMC26660]QNK65897.1 class I SAM-dependent methyltransferase [Variovorax sp. PAMC26660]